jgi:hypothetical protein
MVFVPFIDGPSCALLWDKVAASAAAEIKAAATRAIDREDIDPYPPIGRKKVMTGR